MKIPISNEEIGYIFEYSSHSGFVRFYSSKPTPLSKPLTYSEFKKIYPYTTGRYGFKHENNFKKFCNIKP